MRARLLPAVLLLAALLLPWVALRLDQPFYIGFASRILIFALAASSLNLVLGYGGMVSFGHAAFVGLGAYTVAILAGGGEAARSAWLAWPAAMLVSAAAAAVVGAVCLRTRGVHFIMITLAFAQMLYYLLVSLKAYGGDDGISLVARSTLGSLRLADDTTFYFVVLALLALSLLLLHRLSHARFGRVVAGIREDEVRMEALGYATFGYRWLCFVIAAAFAGLSGALLVNQNSFVSPNALHWTQSGQLMIMVLAGGTGRLFGGVAGAVFLLGLEELLSAYTTHWQLPVGLLLLALVYLAPQGLLGLGRRRR